MSTLCGLKSFILTWNPSEQWQGDPRRVVQWSTGPSDPGIEPGDRLYLFRQRGIRGNRGNWGIVAVGYALSSVFPDESWSDPTKERHYVRVEWSMLENCVHIDRLTAEVPEGKWTTRYRRSGVILDTALARKVDRLVIRQKQDLGP